MAKTFKAWLSRQPKGTRARLIKATSERTVRGAQEARPLSYRLAEALSAAVGGEFSVEALCKPVKGRAK